MQSNVLTSAEFRRFQHQINMPYFGILNQEKLRLSKILVIGSGGIGAQVLQLLAASGVGKITFVDDELVTEKNIQLQTLYGGNDLGKLKTIISKQNLQNLYPFTKFEILNLKLDDSNIEQFIEGYDLIIDASNTENTHYIINDCCIEKKLPWIYGHVDKYVGEVTVFNYQNGPSYRCLYPSADIDKESDLASSFALIYSTAGCLMVNEGLKLIFKSDNILSGKILNFDLFSNLFVYQNIDRVDSNFVS